MPNSLRLSGWKFDVEGRCCDMPTSHPAAREHGGMIWAYMGPPERMPLLPARQGARVPAWQDCNWVQAIEGSIDTGALLLCPSRSRQGREGGPRHRDTLPRPCRACRSATCGGSPAITRSARMTRASPLPAAASRDDAIHGCIARFLMPVHATLPGETRFGQTFVPVNDTTCW